MPNFRYHTFTFLMNRDDSQEGYRNGAAYRGTYVACLYNVVDIKGILP